MIIRGTTPTLSFSFGLDWDNVEDVSIAFAYDSKILFKIDKTNISYDDGFIYTTLSQIDTLKLSAKENQIQIKVKLSDGSVLASNTIKERIGDILDSEVM